MLKFFKVILIIYPLLAIIQLGNALPPGKVFSKPKNTHKKAIKTTSTISLEAPYYDSNLNIFTSWGIDPNKNTSINALGAWKDHIQKDDVVVAVIDTGIDPTHPLIKDNLYLPGGMKIDQDHFGYDFSKKDSTPSQNKKTDSFYTPFDSHGHGTHVAGIIKTVFPKVKLIILKYFNPQASGKDNLESTIEALRYAVSLNVDIINYSGGGPDPAAEELRIIKKAKEKGILIVAAAGNEENNIDQDKKSYYPASYTKSDQLDNILTVSAYDENLKILASSNYGKSSVDIMAPGNRINSSIPNNRSAFLTGTSQATAFASGVAALLKSNFPQLSASDLRNIIRDSARTEVTFMGKCATNGRLDATAALEMAKKKYHQGNDNKSSEPQRKLATTKKEKIKEGKNKIVFRLMK